MRNAFEPRPTADVTPDGEVDVAPTEPRTNHTGPTHQAPATAPGPPPEPPNDEPSPFDPPVRHPARRRALMIGGFALALAGAGAGVYYATRGARPAAAPAGHSHGGGAPAPAQASPVMLTRAGADRIGVTYAPVERAPLTREIRTVGLVTFDETRVKVIAPKIDGWIEQLYVNYTGQAVRRGEPLFAIYAPMLVTAQEELLLARRLASDVREGSGDARRSADDLVTSARRRLAYWDIPADEIAAVERSGQVRRTLTLRSPVDGFVVDKPLLSGQRIMAGETVYRIADLRMVWVDGEIFEQYAPLARVGAQVTLEFAALPGTRRTGRVTYVYPTLNQQTRTVRVRVALPNPGATLKPGMYATLRLTNPSAAPVLSVPRSAVLATGTRVLVFVKKPDGTLAPQDVTLGQATDERIEILTGLASTDTVVSSATFLVDAESNLKSALGGMGNMPGMGAGGPTPSTPTTPTPPMPSMPSMPNVPTAPHAAPGGA